MSVVKLFFCSESEKKCQIFFLSNFFEARKIESTLGFDILGVVVDEVVATVGLVELAATVVEGVAAVVATVVDEVVVNGVADDAEIVAIVDDNMLLPSLLMRLYLLL